jgi:hypothetical protein
VGRVRPALAPDAGTIRSPSPSAPAFAASAMSRTPPRPPARSADASLECGWARLCRTGGMRIGEGKQGPTLPYRAPPAPVRPRPGKVRTRRASPLFSEPRRPPPNSVKARDYRTGLGHRRWDLPQFRKR